MTTMGGVRRSDPATSRAAAESMTEPVLAGQKLAVLRVIDLFGGAFFVTYGRPTWTAYEISKTRRVEGLPRQQSVVSKRCSELHDRGFIFDTGERRPGSSGRLLIVWAITEKGREALRRAEEVSR